MRIAQARETELEEILAVQRLAYLSEAALYQDYSIPPLTQRFEELRQEFLSGCMLKAEDAASGRLVGSVRGRVCEGVLYIGKLVVHPDFQGRGIGTRLLQTIEELHPGLPCELFTGGRSMRNLQFYTRLGYLIQRRERPDSGPELVFLRKEPG